MAKQRLGGFCLEEVKAALGEYEKEVESTSLARKTKDTYLRHAQTFVRWLEGDFEPGSRT